MPLICVSYKAICNCLAYISRGIVPLICVLCKSILQIAQHHLSRNCATDLRLVQSQYQQTAQHRYLSRNGATDMRVVQPQFLQIAQHRYLSRNCATDLRVVQIQFCKLLSIDISRGIVPLICVSYKYNSCKLLSIDISRGIVPLDLRVCANPIPATSAPASISLEELCH